MTDVDRFRSERRREVHMRTTMGFVHRGGEDEDFEPIVPPPDQDPPTPPE